MGTPLYWVVFNIFVLVAIVLDLKVFHRRPHRISVREAGLFSAIWIALAVAFGLLIYFHSGEQPALEFFTGYVIEKSLSIDNLFLFLVIFSAFHVDERVQHRLLEWGIVGALLMRGAMIGAGAALIERFSWVLYLFGAFLIYAGVHMLFAKKKETHPEQNAVFRFAKKHLRVTHEVHGERFFVRREEGWFATPLLLVLLVVEITDITLAVDSIPAIFGITRDPFIVYTSNVFAILGLRALYFLLAGVLGKFRFLTAGLSGVLIFIGGKMLAEHWTDIPIYVSLAVVAAILGSALVLSLAFPVKKRADSGHGEKAKSAAGPREEQQAGSSIASAIECLASGDASVRERGATEIFLAARRQVEEATRQWWQDAELSGLLFAPEPRITAGIAVGPERFAAVRAANATPRLSEVPPDQDAREFELHFPGGVSLDVLTTREPGGNGAIARYLAKFGEGIQQVEFHCAGVDRATQILRERFHCNPVYAQARAGADGTRINFFLVPAAGGAKVLIELYEVAA
ncbi:MAG TPA: TerC/Alx family metal homeostasis membrane protein [Candidatus Acidoferrum sp.]|nr:TerC/Alx family metal homeostasis membrane protein [Candidatus Acidoferrum sp.]